MLIFEQSGVLTYHNSDLPLSTSYLEGTRGLNLDTNDKLTLKDGVWVEGWYEPYITGGIGGLSTVDAVSIIDTQNSEKVRELRKTSEIGFIDELYIMLGAASSLEVDIIFEKQNVDQPYKLLTSIKYFKYRDTAYTSSINIYGDNFEFNLVEVNLEGIYGVHVITSGDWVAKTYIKNIIL
jgi:hypothetical protein